MSKVADVEGLLILGVLAGGAFLAYKLYSGVSSVLPDVAHALDPYDLQKTKDDASIARYIIDHPQGGYIQAARWFSPSALKTAWDMASGSGTAPDPGSYLANLYPPFSGVSGDW